MTRELGVRYLWIDSLGIIQDDEKDWADEAAMMHMIYALSYLNIAATSSVDGDGGCFPDRWTSARQSQLPVRSHKIEHEIEGQSISFYARRILSKVHTHFTDLEPPNAEEILNAAPLLSRAWVMQERFLAARTVHFHSEELVWECESNLLCECGGLDNRQNGLTQQGTRVKSACAEAFHEDTDAKGLGELWFDLVALYSRLKLTKESDSDFNGFISYQTATYFGFEADRRLRIIAASSNGAVFTMVGQIPNSRLELLGAFVSTTLIHDDSTEFTSSFLVADCNETEDTVVINREDLCVDVPLHSEDPDQLPDGEALHCLLIGHTTRDMARDGQRPELFDLSLVLKQSAFVTGSFERVGILQSRKDEGWYREATGLAIIIV